MIEVDIPGVGKYQFHHLVLDVNGTIAKDGQLIAGVAELLAELRSSLDIHLITADTFGTQGSLDRLLNLTSVRIPQQNQIQAKLDYLERLGFDRVVAIGNGANDAGMIEHAALGIAIIGPEGSAVTSLLRADVAVADIRTALELLLYPQRLIATLRQ